MGTAVGIDELASLIERDPAVAVAVLAIAALGRVWALWRTADTANDAAAVTISDQKLLTLRADLTIERRDDQLKDRDDKIGELKQRIERLERELDQCRNFAPRPEATR